MTKIPDREVIVKIGAEGGSITLFGVRRPPGWLYSRSVDEFIDEEVGGSQHDSNVVDSWKAALGLLDLYPWHRLSLQHVHPEFRRRILAAVRESGLRAVTIQGAEWKNGVNGVNSVKARAMKVCDSYQAYLLPMF